MHCGYMLMGWKRKGQGIFNKVLDLSTFVCHNFLQMLTLDVMHSYNMFKSVHVCTSKNQSLKSMHEDGV